MNVLIYGSGQLARMMYLAACPLGINVLAVDVNNQTVVDPVSKKAAGISLEEAINRADALSVEFEHIPEPLLERASMTDKLMPSMEAILVGADRVREKRLLEKLRIANAAHRIIDHVDQLEQSVKELGDALIIKASRDGYDGYGQWRIRDTGDIETVKQQLTELDLQKVPLIVEKMVPFERELSLVGVRSQSGEVRFYPLAENLHHEGQLHVSIAPAPSLTNELNQQAQKSFHALVEELDYVGVLAVEFFQVGEQLLINELAPRVHNSGHWSMQGADTSQFENHIRAICNLPLGGTDSKHPSAMINIIGCDDFSDDLLSISRCHLHLYGKNVRPKRKMGHINLTGENYSELAEAMTTLAKYLPVEHFPRLMDEADRLATLKG